MRETTGPYPTYLHGAVTFVISPGPAGCLFPRLKSNRPTFFFFVSLSHMEVGEEFVQHIIRQTLLHFVSLDPVVIKSKKLFGVI